MHWQKRDFKAHKCMCIDPTYRHMKLATKHVPIPKALHGGGVRGTWKRMAVSGLTPVSGFLQPPPLRGKRDRSLRGPSPWLIKYVCAG